MEDTLVSRTSPTASQTSPTNPSPVQEPAHHNPQPLVFLGKAGLLQQPLQAFFEAVLPELAEKPL